MNHNNTIFALLFISVFASYAYAKSDEPQVGNAKGSGEGRRFTQKDAERYRKAAEAGDVEAQEMMGWAYYDKNAAIEDKTEAIKWWCRVGHRGSEMMKAILRLAYHGDERVLIDNAADAITANGGRPLSITCDAVKIWFLSIKSPVPDAESIMSAVVSDDARLAQTIMATDSVIISLLPSV